MHTSKMHRLIATLCILIIIIATCSVSARPTNLLRHKRQSDQRLAELETLLALQKYGRHRLRPDRKDDSQAGYGLVDFNRIGRRKKSTRFSPGEGRQKEDVFSPNSSSNSMRIIPETETDPSENEKIDSLISLPSLLIENQPQEQRGIYMEEKK